MSRDVDVVGGDVTGSGYTLPDHEEFSEYRVKDLRVWIGKKSGCRIKPTSPLTLAAMNSIHAHLTGEFICKPQLLNTKLSPGVHHFRIEIANVCGVEGYPFTNETRPFRKGELEVIARKMDETPNQRDWMLDALRGGQSDGE
jgi:hypothetical protein